MPSLTPKQHNAMAAAKGGKSNIGIPQKVGAEFMAADRGQTPRKKYSTAGMAKAFSRKPPMPSGDKGASQAFDEGG